MEEITRIDPLQSLRVEDNPIPEGERDTIIQDTGPVEATDSPKTSNRKAIQAAVMNGVQSGMNIIGSYSDIRQLDPETTRTALARQLGAEEASTYRDLAESEGITGNLEEDILTMEAVNDVTDQALEDSGNATLQYLKSLGSPETRRDVLEQMTVEQDLAMMASNVMNDMGGMDWLYAIGELFVPGAQIKDNIEFTGSVFKGEEAVKHFINSFRALPVNEQRKQLPTVKARLEEVFESDLRVSQILTAMSTEDAVRDISDFNAYWAALDIGLSLFEFGAFFAKLRKSTKAIATAKKLDNSEISADMLAAGILDSTEEARTLIEESKRALVNKASPFNVEGIDASYVEGMSAEVIGRINRFEKEQVDFTEEVLSGKFSVQIGMLNTDEKLVRESKTLEKLNALDGVEGVTITGRSEKGFQVEYSLGKEEVKSHSFGYKVSDVGAYEMDDASLARILVGSKTIVAKRAPGKSAFTETSARRLDVDAAQQIDNIEAGFRNQMRDMHSEALTSIFGKGVVGSVQQLNPVRRKKLAKINNVMRALDEQDLDEVPTYVELKAGINGTRLAEDEIEAFYKLRSMMDNHHILRSTAKRHELDVKGYKYVPLGKDTDGIAKPYAKASDGNLAIRAENRKTVYDSELDTVVDYDPDIVTQAYEDGYVMVRFRTPYRPKDANTSTFYGIVKADGVEELPISTMRYRANYIPKLNDQASYFVKSFNAQNVDGRDIKATSGPGIGSRTSRIETERTFSNKREAKAWAEQENARLKEEGVSEEDIFYEALEDRQLEKERSLADMGESLEHGGGGLFEGARSKKVILHGFDGELPDRVDTFEAISRSISSLSKHLPRNEWRMGAEQRAVKTAHALGHLEVESFQDLKKFAAVKTDVGRYLDNLYKTMEDWMGVPTVEENLFEASVQRLIDSQIGAKMPKFADQKLHWLRHKDPIASARSVAFHGLLGWLNPIQLWVQAQGAAVAISANLFKPKQLGAVFRDTGALTALSSNASKADITHIAKAMKMEVSDLEEMYLGLKRSKLLDGVLATADHAAAAKGRGVAMDALSRTADKGLFFYRRGELFNRRMSFSTSYREWKDLNKGKELTEDGLKQILSRSNDFMLGLGKANRAKFQKGIFGIPTQFMQVSTKSIETMLGMNGNFTGAERGRIMATQLGLYGAAGIPLSSLGSRYLQESLQFTGVEITPEMEKGINEGMVGWTTLAVFGADVEVGERSSLMHGINETAMRFMYDESTFGEKVLGAFGTVNSRFWDSFFGDYEPMSLGIAGTREFNLHKLVANPFLDSLSTWRNIDKALLMNQLDMLVSRKGQVVDRAHYALSTQIMTAIGFRPMAEVLKGRAQERNKVSADYRKAVTTKILDLNLAFARKAVSGNMTEEDRENHRGIRTFLYQTLLTDRDRRLVKESVWNAETATTTALGREMNKYMKDTSEKHYMSLENIRGSVKGLLLSPAMLKSNVGKEK